MSLLSVVLAGGGATRTLTAPFTVGAPPSSGTNFLLNPSAHIATDGLPYPDATNSGAANYVVPSLGRPRLPSEFTPSAGFTTTHAGQVIEGYHFTGTSSIKIAHPDVVVVGNIVEYTGSLFAITDHKTGLTSGSWTMDYNTFKCAPPCLAPLNCERAKMHWNDISGGTDGWDPYNINSVEFLHNFVHDLTPFNGSHSDCIQIVGGDGPCYVRHNTLLSTNPSYPIGAYHDAVQNWKLGDPAIATFPGNTSGLQLGQLTGDIGAAGDVFIEDNLMDGGNFPFNANWASDGTHNLVGHIYIRNNRYGRDHRYYWNYSAGDTLPATGLRAGGGLYIHINDGKHNVVIAGNVWDDNGQPA